MKDFTLKNGSAKSLYRMNLSSLNRTLKPRLLNAKRSIIGNILERGFPPLFEYSVTSYGGSCTSTLIRFLNPRYGTKTNHQWYFHHLKHRLEPPLEFTHDFKAIYIFGDPIESLISIYRRGLQREHFYNVFQRRPDGNFPKTLAEYAELGTDYFQLERQFDSWTGCPTENRKFPIVLIRSQDLWDNLEHLAYCLKLPRESIQVFPKRHERNAKLNELEPIIKKRLVETYSPLQSKIQLNRGIRMI